MEILSKAFQKSKRGFLKLSIASSLVSSAFLVNKNCFANQKTNSNDAERKLKMTKKVILEFKVRNDNVKPLMAFLAKNLANVRNFDGCSQVEVYHNPEEEKMIFDEVWESVEHHQQYLGHITDNGVMAELASFLVSKPEIKYFDSINL
ncbi:MAG: antibiotic biosynthesis monooxygenase [Gammaproteobacteria bacterium]|nr:antibiotic biosynthesis monooxygenase [Gammaproteobacteria bacterium]